MESIKALANGFNSIDYDERDFIMSTQEGQLKPQILARITDNDTPRVNLIKGLTPNLRLMSSQISGEQSQTEVMTSANQAPTLSSKGQFQGEIAFSKVEPKRSVSVSAKKSAAELMQPYNRRAQLLRERKDQIKLQARENSFQRSQKKTDSINRLYSRPAEGAKNLFKPNSMSVSHKLLNTSISNSTPLQTQIHTQTNAISRFRNQAASMLLSDHLDQSSFEQAEPVLGHNNRTVQGKQGQVLVKQASRIQQPESSKYFCNPVETEMSLLGLEKTKQLINQKFQNLVAWGKFSETLSRQHDNGSTIRSFDGIVINQHEQQINKRNLPQELGEMPPTFGADQNTFGVFTPPALKNFKLTVDARGRIVPFTERLEECAQEAEGVIPNPKRSPFKLNAFTQKIGVKIAQPADHSIRGEVTLNPNGQHGVAVSSSNTNSKHLKGKNDSQTTRRMPIGTPAKSTKSLRDLLSGTRRNSQSSLSVKEQNHTVKGVDISHVMYESLTQINSPNMAGTKTLGHMPIHNHNQSQVIQKQQRRLEQENYPCSAFFQNDENFEKAHVTIGNSFQLHPNSPILYSKMMSQSGQLELESIGTAQDLFSTRKDDTTVTIQQSQKFITSFHPPASTQVEEDLAASIAQQLQHCQSPVVARNHIQMHQCSTNQNNIVIGRQSLTTRKNFTHQKQTSPAMSQGNHNRMIQSKLYAKNYDNFSPKFKVIDQQKETSMSRCSFKSINHKQIDDDLPPDPMAQFQTLEKPTEQPQPVKADEDRRTLQTRVLRKDQITTDSLRNEIIAVAPKPNQLALVEQTSLLSLPTSTMPDFDSSQPIEIQEERRRAYNAVTAVMSPKGQKADLQKPEKVKMTDDDNGLTDSEKKRKKRASSFIKDGYEIYIEGTYIVEGRKKKKIKKRKLSKMVLEKHNKAIEEKVRKEKEAGHAAQAARLEKELQVISDLGRYTEKLPAGQKMITLKTSQVQMKTIAQQQLNIIKLQKQTGSQQNLASGQISPRLSRQISLKKNIKLTSSKVESCSSSQATLGLQKQQTSSNQKQINKIKLQTVAKPQPPVQIPRQLFIKRQSKHEDSTEEVKESKPSQSPYIGHEVEEQKGLKKSDTQQSLMMASARSLNFRDPDLQLITSSRLLTMRDVSNQMFGGCSNFILHRMIFQKKFAELLKVFKTGFLEPQHLNERDHQGNTPILLAAKLSAHEEEYLKCINFLFKHGCDGKLRDGNGWSILDEAIVQANSRLLGIAFGWLNIHKKEKIRRNKLRVIERLKRIPDFYVELHWECQSSWIPFLSKIAPSDDFQIWKVGSNIRLDFSLVGFKNLKNKRRRMSIFFRNAEEDESDERYKDIDIVMVNRDRKILSNPLEDLDEEEKLAVLTDIMNADPVQNELNITRQDWSQMSNFFGSGFARETVNGYDCSKFKLQIQAQVRSKKKVSQSFNHTYDSYFEGAEDFKEGQKTTLDPSSFKKVKDVEKTVESQLWLSQEYPLQFGQFMEVLDTLAISGQASMQKIHEFLKTEVLGEVISRHGFPVKIQVPIGLSVKAMVTFGNFEFLFPENKEEFIKETFKVPSYCNLVSRKEAMKTMESKKKRLAVANVVI